VSSRGQRVDQRGKRVKADVAEGVRVSEVTEGRRKRVPNPVEAAEVATEAKGN
jgi:hypothetical protein